MWFLRHVTAAVPAALLCIVVVTVQPLESAAAASDAQITVTVTDASTHAPVALADVTLFGPAPLFGITGRDGSVVFEEAPPGTYHGSVTKPGYTPTKIGAIAADPGALLIASVSISKLIKTIGTVTVKKSSVFRISAIDRSDPSVTASGSMSEGLVAIPSLNLGSSAGNAQTISVEGHNPSQSALFADGAPLSPVGISQNLRAVATDIFDAGAARSGNAFGVGGGVDFHVPDPTLAYAYSAQAKYGTFDSSAATVFVRGTAGYLGFSAGHSGSRYVNQLNGKVYLDQSGFAYPHDASSHTSGDVLKVRVPLSSTDVLSGVFFTSNYHAADYCNVIGGILPCGFGPGNDSWQRLASWQIKNTRNVSDRSYVLQAFSTTLRGHDDESRRFLDGVAQPLAVSFDAKTSGLSASVALSGRRRHALSASALQYTTQSSGFGQFGQIFGAAPSQKFTFRRFGIADAYRVSQNFGVTAELGHNAVSGNLQSLFGNVALSWTRRPGHRITASFLSGAVNPSSSVIQGFTDPSLLQFDCSAGVAYGTAPGPPAQPTLMSEERLSVDERSPSVQWSLSAYHQVLHGAILDTFISGDHVADMLYPPGYLSVASRYFSAVTGCDRPANLTKADLALRLQLPGTATYEGGTLAARISVVPGIVMQPFFAVTVAKSGQLQLGSSLYPGHQLLGVPLRKHGVAFDWKTRHRIEIVATYEHTSANNPNFLPAYSIVDAGAILPLQHGQLVASVSNVFDRFAQPFGSSSIGGSLERVDSPHLRLIGIPLEPRRFRVAYEFQVGAPAAANASDQSADSGLATSATFSAPPLPSAPPQDPYAINVENSQCGPESAALARPFLEGMHDYMNAATFESAHRFPDGETVRYRAGARVPSFLITGSNATVQAAVFACSVVHAGTAAQAGARGVYAPTATDTGLYDLLFSPAVGFYITYDIARTVTRTSFLLPYRGKPDVNPFALPLQASSCVPEQRSAASYVVAQLQSYLTARREGRVPAAPVDGITIAEHRDPRPWSSFTFADPFVQNSLTSCARVFEITAHQLRTLGISSSGAGRIDFAWPVGFYEYVP